MVRRMSTQEKRLDYAIYEAKVEKRQQNYLPPVYSSPPMTKIEDAKQAQKIYENGVAELLDQYEEMLVEEGDFLVFATLLNPLMAIPAKWELEKAKDIFNEVNFAAGAGVDYDDSVKVVMLQKKMKKIRDTTEKAKKECYTAIIAVLIMAFAFLVVGWFHIFGILAFLLTILYIVGVSIWFIFGKKLTDKKRDKKQFEKRQDLLLEMMANRLARQIEEDVTDENYL
ncbi:Oidioi.mRNA.OKI2018_I69.chr2.g4402.t1.cds [Oikopleura dioica]|uniref:Oidioi.mRNA.OKI2018_I69.chr2.g4402.t1.cds n=1 Tax=Oikopleura dioica TaxID=34765 RepID=A0ABN7T2P9_OIKDI|nr:Oidioi.mRNA.OKI2018_I69.chr2.g4402.t1.cds [Oikopleura dioica]